MKKKIIYGVIGFVIGVLISSVVYNIPRIKYDTNRDGKITLNDAVRVINYYKERRIKQSDK